MCREAGLRDRMEDTVAIVGAGMGGLAAAILLAGAGLHVVVVEAADGPGGKLRQVTASGRHFDAGPTVLTWGFAEGALAALKAWLEGRAQATGRAPQGLQ